MWMADLHAKCLPQGQSPPSAHCRNLEFPRAHDASIWNTALAVPGETPGYRGMCMGSLSLTSVELAILGVMRFRPSRQEDEGRAGLRCSVEAHIAFSFGAQRSPERQ